MQGLRELWWLFSWQHSLNFPQRKLSNGSCFKPRARWVWAWDLGGFQDLCGPLISVKISPNWSSYHLHTGPNILMVYNPFGRVQKQWGPCKLGWGNFLVHSDGPTGGRHPRCATCAPDAPNYSTHTHIWASIGDNQSWPSAIIKQMMTFLHFKILHKPWYNFPPTPIVGYSEKLSHKQDACLSTICWFLAL